MTEAGLEALFAALKGSEARYCVLGHRRDDDAYLYAASFHEHAHATRYAKVLARERPRVCKSFVILDREEGRVRGVVSAREPEKTDGEA